MDVAARLAALGPDGLGRLLEHRPDVLVGRAPRNLAELAQRLHLPRSVTDACRALDVPQLQVLNAVNALGESAGLHRVAELLDADPRPQVQRLAERGLVWPDGDVVRTTRDVRLVAPDLLGLGPSFDDIAYFEPHPVLQRAERALGLPVGRSKPASVAALREFYADPERVRDSARGRLTEQAIVDLLNRASDLAHGVGARYDDDAVTFDDGYEMDSWEYAEMVDGVGLQSGLAIGEYSRRPGSVTMPSEVALALRGPAYRIRFDPEPPPVVWLPVSRVANDAAAALAAFDAATTAVLDHVAARPLTVLKRGGLGRREVQRVGKATSLDDDTVTLVLELAASLGLVAETLAVEVTDAFPTWRDGEPADRVAALARAWWVFPGRPSSHREIEGPDRPTLTGAPCNDCRAARMALLGSLRTDAGVGRDDATSIAWWHAPSSHLAESTAAVHWREAELLGAIAQGALTDLGVALRNGHDDALRVAAAAGLPASSVSAVFGSDLTAVVPGSPSAVVSRTLDSCAVRESSGGAVTWRLSPSSVRTALDDGATVDGLRGSLRSIAAGGALPAAVEVLLDDVARLHGRAVVQAASGVVVCDDAALLAQMTHDRKLSKLGLRVVAPTVLTATADAATVATTLRGAGYMPAWTPEPSPRQESGLVGSWRRPTPDPAASSSTDPFDLARRLLAAGVAAAPPTVTERQIGRYNPLLTGDQAAVLAAAVDAQERVEIVYESATGGVTERVVRPRQLVGDRVLAWCELRSDEREFVVARVLGVRAV